MHLPGSGGREAGREAGRQGDRQAESRQRLVLVVSAWSSSSAPGPLRQRLVAAAVVAEMPSLFLPTAILIYTVAAAAPPTVAAKGEWATRGILTSRPLR